jgi:hypothetical protein
MNELDSRTARRIAAIEAAISISPLSALDIAEAISLCHQSALEYVRYLLGDDPKIGDRIHIESWYEIEPGRRVPLYRWGGGKNKRKPRPATKEQSNRAYRERVKVRKTPRDWMTPLFAGRLPLNAEG